jgi:polysaccharide biosynthesis transport protein
MANDDALTTNERADLATLGALVAADSRRNNAQAFEQPAPDVMAVVHAVRRHWLSIASMGILCAAIAGPAVYFGWGDRFTASAFLRVPMHESSILPTAEVVGADRDRFEVYKNTQQALLQNRFVLLAAIRKSEVKQIPAIQDNQDAATWLGQQLSISFPQKAEVLEVDVTRQDPKEAATLVNAVVDAYLTEVVNAEKNLKQQRLNELDRAFASKETDIRDRRTELKQLSEKLGTDEKETLTLREKLAIEELTLYRQEMAKLLFDLRQVQGALAAQQGMLKSIDTIEIADAELDSMVQTDPVARQLFIELGWRSTDQAYNQGRVVAGKPSHIVDRYQQDLKTLQDQFDSRRTALMDVARQRRRAMVQADIMKLEASLAVMKDQEKILQLEVDDKQREAEKFGQSTVDVEMMRADIKNLDTLLTGISSEKERLNVEMRSAARVTLIQRADTPEVPSNAMLRIALSAMAMLAGFCCPAAAIALWDTRSRRINNSDDVSRGLQLPVIGSMPLVPSRVIRHLESPSKRYHTWHVRLTESVDGIAARMLRKADLEPCRVIMISSAVGGEGKTTLAMQLAMSLARVKRRTVLVDFDLRCPTFHREFGQLPLEPGVCDILRGQSVLADVAHETAIENLSVITAGRLDRFTSAALSSGGAATLFKELRETYDFVVVDTSPILPVADARFVSQHVDAVLLSVLRDVSEAPKIQATSEILAAFGVRSVEAVVTTPNEHLHGVQRTYEAAVSA